MSRPHARVCLENGDYWIEDLNSKRGPQVNGEDIKGSRRLQAGDPIRMGETTPRVEIPIAQADSDAARPREAPGAEKTRHIVAVDVKEGALTFESRGGETL